MATTTLSLVFVLVVVGYTTLENSTEYHVHYTSRWSSNEVPILLLCQTSSMTSYLPEVDIKALANFLTKPEEVDEDDLEVDSRNKTAALTPAIIAETQASGSHRKPKKSCQSFSKKKEKDLLGDIWDVNEVNTGQCEDPVDPRKKPEYEISYKERLTASNIYLPMSDVACSGRGEEDLVVRVVIPGDLLTEVTLEVTSSTLNLASPNHLLQLPLPRSVDQAKGVATWDPAKHTLLVTLPVLHQPLLKPVKHKH